MSHLCYISLNISSAINTFLCSTNGLAYVTSSFWFKPLMSVNIQPLHSGSCVDDFTSAYFVRSLFKQKFEQTAASYENFLAKTDHPFDAPQMNFNFQVFKIMKGVRTWEVCFYDFSSRCNFIRFSPHPLPPCLPLLSISLSFQPKFKLLRSFKNFRYLLVTTS